MSLHTEAKWKILGKSLGDPTRFANPICQISLGAWMPGHQTQPASRQQALVAASSRQTSADPRPRQTPDDTTQEVIK